MAVFDPDHGYGFRSRLTPNYSSSGLGCNCGAPPTLVPPRRRYPNAIPRASGHLGSPASLPRHRGRSMILSSGDSESGPGPFGGDWDEADLDRLAIGCNRGHWIIVRYMGTESIPFRAYAKLMQSIC
jgi:hypothetical protein